MPRIPEETIERIRNATDIVEVVSGYVDLAKKGRNFWGLCPFHGEKTPSFSVNPDLQIYKCFGCSAGGHVFKFIQEMDRVSFVEAVSFLAQRCNIPLPSRDDKPNQDDASDVLYRANDLARKYFHHLLAQPEGQTALTYLQNRQVNDDTIARFGLGYAPPAWDGLLKVAGRRGLAPTDLEKAGLVLPRKSGAGYYDRFRQRLAFPIANLSGRTVAFGARALEEGQEPKYLNSSETPIYQKSRILYGLDLAREPIRQQDRVLIVEGYMDLLRLAQHGLHYAVATSGTALTQEHCRLLNRYAKQAVLVFDGDAAGSDAAIRGLEVVLAAGLDARVVSLPEGHDPDTFVHERGPDALLELVEGAGEALDFLMDRLAKRADLSTLAGRAAAVESVKPLLASVRDAVRRDLMLREVALRLRVDEMALRQELGQSLRRGRRSEPAQTQKTKKGPPRPEQELLGLLLKYPQFIQPTAQQIEPQFFQDPRSVALATLLFKNQDSTLDVAGLMNRTQDPELVELISTCAMLEYGESQVEEQWHDYIRHLHIETLSHQIDSVKQAMQEANQAGDQNTLRSLQNEAMRLIQVRRELQEEAQNT